VSCSRADGLVITQYNGSEVVYAIWVASICNIRFSALMCLLWPSYLMRGCFGNCSLIYWIILFQILVEVDNLQDVPSPYIQIKGVDKEAVAAAGSMLKLDGSYTTKVLLKFINQ